SSRHARKSANRTRTARSNVAGSTTTKPLMANVNHRAIWPRTLASMPPSGSRAASVCMIGLQQGKRRNREDVEVEQDRPVLDVVEVVLDPTLDLFTGVGLAAPTLDLGPAGDARLDLVAGKIAVDDVGVEAVCGPGHDRVRTR